jgi:hypothetical protein
MTLTQTIQQHVANFPPDKQAEVLDFVLFLEQRLRPSKRRQTEEKELARINQHAQELNDEALDVLEYQVEL